MTVAPAISESHHCARESTMSDTIANQVQNFLSPTGNDIGIVIMDSRGLSRFKFSIFSACECRKGTPVPVTLFKRKIFLKNSCSIRVSLSSCTYLNSTSKHYSHSGLHSRLPNPIPSNLNTYIAPASLWEPEFGITLRKSRTALVGHSKSLKW